MKMKSILKGLDFKLFWDTVIQYFMALKGLNKGTNNTAIA